MEKYEALIIFPSQAAAEPLSEGKNPFEEAIKKFEGKVINRSELGRRSIGYPIKKAREGYFAAFDFELTPDKVEPLTRALRLTETILRFTIVKKRKQRVRRIKTSSKPVTTHRTPTAEKPKVHQYGSKS